MNKDELIPRLISDYHYSQKGAELVAEKLANLTPQIMGVFVKYWEGGELADIEVEGFTVKNLMSDHGMNIIAALLTLDWLVRDPIQAAASLKKGHDRVSSKK